MATLAQQPAKLLLAEKRIAYESDVYRCLSTPVHKHRVEKTIPRLSDETLAPQKSRLFTSDEDATVIVLPLVGPIVCESATHKPSIKIAPEELQVLSLKAGDYFSIKSPSSEELVNYLQLWITRPAHESKISFSDYVNNTLKTILKTPSFNLHFGVFDGRMEDDFVASKRKNSLVTFVINGAFEVQNRLLESRDCLMLWNTKKIELEALSENAIILVLEKDNSC